MMNDKLQIMNSSQNREAALAYRPSALVYAPALTLRDVSVSYHNGRGAKERALEGVSLTVATGERVAVVGPNGAGKSTLFKLLIGDLKKLSGQVEIKGKARQREALIGYIPQKSQIDWTFPATVEEVVMMGRVGHIGFLRWPRRRDWEIVHASLERVRAGHLAKKQIGALSGGQQQRVFIARTLAQEAQLLLLDEPLSGLDAPSREEIFAILDTLRVDRVTVLLSTHDLNLAAGRFDQVVLLNKRVIAAGQPDTVLTKANLLSAYGGHMHVIESNGHMVVFTDTCCDHGEAA